MKGIGYVRVSTKAQAGDDRFGIEVQKKQIETYCAENDIELIEVREEYASGTDDTRPIWNELITCPGEIDCVIVFKNDRAARDMKYYFYSSYKLSQSNVRLVSVQEDFDEEDGLANIYRAIFQFIAEQERKNIILRTSLGQKAKASHGGYAGGRTPFGYDTVNGQLRPNRDAEIVRLIFRLRDSGLKINGIMNWLRDNGIEKNGHAWSFGNIQSILKNEELYRGNYKYGEMEWVEGNQEAILWN